MSSIDLHRKILLKQFNPFAKKLDKFTIEKIKNMYSYGFSISRIAKDLNLNRKTVKYHLDKEYRKKVLETLTNIMKEKLKDKKYYLKHLEYRKNTHKITYRLIKELRVKYPEYDMICRESRTLQVKYGYKKAYRITKKRVLELRKKYNIYFPIY